MDYIRLIIWYWKVKRALPYTTRPQLSPMWHQRGAYCYGYMNDFYGSWRHVSRESNA